MGKPLLKLLLVNFETVSLKAVKRIPTSGILTVSVFCEILDLFWRQFTLFVTHFLSLWMKFGCKMERRRWTNGSMRGCAYSQMFPRIESVEGCTAIWTSPRVRRLHRV